MSGENAVSNTPQQGQVISLDTLIYQVRGQDVMLDSDLAATYQTSTKRINEAVNRNRERFPKDFSFQLSQSEWDILRSQIATLKNGHGQHRKYIPRVFTEHGAVMLATVLNSTRAIEASKDIVRAFVRLRHSSTVLPHDNRSLYDYAKAFVEEHEQRELADKCIDLMKPKSPFGTISKFNGRPRTKFIPSHFRTSKVIIEMPTEYRHLFNYLQMTNQNISMEDE